MLPQALLGLRLIFGERMMLEAAGRGYYVAGVSSGGGGSETFDREIITRGNAGITVRIFGPHAIGLQYIVSSRNARFPELEGGATRPIETVSLSYNFLGHTRFGAVEWRPAATAAR